MSDRVYWVEENPNWKALRLKREIVALDARLARLNREIVARNARLSRLNRQITGIDYKVAIYDQDEKEGLEPQ